MFYFKDLKIKVGDMRKDQEFTCYGFKDDKTIFQSNTRIFEVDLKTKTIRLSQRCSNGAYFHHLNKILGAKDFELTSEQLEKILAYKLDYEIEQENRKANNLKFIIESV